MGKKSLKARIKSLKKDLRSFLAPVQPPKAAKPVSPLAPAAFPDLPSIAGVEFSAVEAGVRYPNRRDVMLVRLAAGTTIAGAFTRSTTRSACVRDCQAKLALKAVPDLGAAIIVNSGNSNAFTGKLGDVMQESAQAAMSLTLLDSKSERRCAARERDIGGLLTRGGTSPHYHPVRWQRPALLPPVASMTRPLPESHFPAPRYPRAGFR